ncbi:MFS transporter, partial [Escherichia coli]
TAFIADSTREEHRTKAMAMVGASIGVTFAVSMVASPLLYNSIGMGGIFGLTGILSLIAIAVVVWVVPAAPMVAARRVSLSEVLRHAELLRLNFG